MNKPYYFIDDSSKAGFRIDLECPKINHAVPILANIPMFPDFGIEISYLNRIIKAMATIYDRLINQFKFLCLIKFSANFYTVNEEDQRSDEIELFINLRITV